MNTISEPDFESKRVIKQEFSELVDMIVEAGYMDNSFLIVLVNAMQKAGVTNDDAVFRILNANIETQEMRKVESGDRKTNVAEFYTPEA